MELSRAEKIIERDIRKRLASELGRPLVFADQWRVDIELGKMGIGMRHNRETMEDNVFYKAARKRGISFLFHRNAEHEEKSGGRNDRSGD